MNHYDEVNAKLQAAEAYEEKTRGIGGATAQAPIGYYGDEARTMQAQVGRPTLRAQAEAQVGFHREQADKHDRAAAFFRENPAFDEFIQLVRSGAIQF